MGCKAKVRRAAAETNRCGDGGEEDVKGAPLAAAERRRGQSVGLLARVERLLPHLGRHLHQAGRLLCRVFALTNGAWGSDM
jgi:hypothetical protein